MARSVREVTQRADEALDRLKRTTEGRAAQSRRLQRRTKSVATRVSRAVLGAAGLVLAALIYAMVISPLGVSGFMLLVIGVVALMGLLLRYPREETPTRETLKEAELGALPNRVEDWLDRQRTNLPPRAGRQIDELLLRLEVLSAQLKEVGPGAPVAGDARRLIGDHLPRLVDTYLKVQAPYRQPGSEAEAQLHESLATISSELKRLSDQLAKGDLDALAIEGKFLEQRYGDPAALSE
jgi:hypothetical protein